MADNNSGGEYSLKTFAEQCDEIAPTPKKIDLHKPIAIRRELASVYRDMRSGAIEAQDGTRLAYVLDMIRKAYETEILQKRIDDVELLLNRRGT